VPEPRPAGELAGSYAPEPRERTAGPQRAGGETAISAVGTGSTPANRFSRWRKPGCIHSR